MKRIGILSRPDSTQAMGLRTTLETMHPGSTCILPLRQGGASRLSLGAVQAEWDGVELGDLEACYVHGLAHEDPIIPPEPVADVDWRIWQTGHLQWQQEYCALRSLALELAQRGVRMVNPVATAPAQYMRPWLLANLGQAGCRIPPMCVTNDLAEADAFAQKRELAVWAPVTGRAAYQMCLERQRQALCGEGRAPVLLLEGRPGAIVRLVLLNGEVLFAFATQSPQAGPPELLESVRPATIPGGAELAACIHRSTGFDFAEALVVCEDDGLWLYDVDSDPIFAWLPDPWNKAITQALATYLTTGVVEPLRGEGQEFTPRSTFYLRRMLRILFQMEESKYRSS